MADGNQALGQGRAWGRDCGLESRTAKMDERWLDKKLFLGIYSLILVSNA